MYFNVVQSSERIGRSAKASRARCIADAATGFFKNWSDRFIFHLGLLHLARNFCRGRNDKRVYSYFLAEIMNAIPELEFRAEDARAIGLSLFIART